MSAEDARAVLAEVAGLAAEHDWPEVDAFLALLPAAGGPSPLLVAAAPGVDATAFAQWLRRSGTAEVRATALDKLAADPGPALAATRSVIALRCGDLLTPEAIEGAGVVLGRPAAAYTIVLTGAERIRTEDDLAAVSRSVAGTLFDQGSRRLAERSYRLWAAEPVAEFLAGRVTEDLAALTGWIREEPPVPAALEEARAAYALELAGTEDAAGQAGRPSSADRVSDAQVRALRESIAGLRRRVLDQMDADAATLRRELIASLDTLNVDLHHDLDRAGSGRDPGSARPLVERRTARWSTETSQLIQARRERSQRNVLDQLDIVDWAAVGELAPRPDGRDFREVVSEATAMRVVPPPRPVALPPMSAPAAGGGSSPLRTAAIGGVVTAATLAVLGVAVVPIVVAGVAGMAAGVVVENGIGRYTRPRPLAADAHGRIRAELAEAMSAATAELDRIERTARDAVAAEFTRVEQTLAAGSTPPAAASAAGAPVGDRLAGLRGRLTGGTTNQIGTRRQR